MKIVRRLLMVLLAGAPLLYLPLRAAEPQQSPPAETPPAETPPPDAPAAEAAPASEADAPAVAEDTRAEAEEEEDFGERVSADNNLSFPVDI